jgi:hypothetical protein
MVWGAKSSPCIVVDDAVDGAFAANFSSALRFSAPRLEDWGLRTEDWGLGTEDWGLGTED